MIVKQKIKKGAVKTVKVSLCIIYSILWLFIGMVSAFDTYTSILNQDMLLEYEQNPIGVWLIQYEDGKISMFMGVKFAGTIIALGILVFLYHFSKRWAWPIILSLTAFQSWLFWYLTRIN